jgi:hypothetical protein
MAKKAAKKKNKRTETQRKAFLFLREHLQTQEPFTIDEFAQTTGWEEPGTINTYMGKQYKGLVEKVDTPAGQDQRFRVTDAFWKFVSWRRFRGHVTQVRRVLSTYEPKSSQVLIYDFLMPLTNEEYLRMTLDALFYKDRVLARLRTIGTATLTPTFPKPDGQSDDDYFAGILDFIKDHFIGYSINHVAGRFRSDTLLTQDEAAALQKRGERYLIDETTAVTRFIFPYTDAAELARIKFLFQILFIRSIIQLVNGEEQIWMVQSGSDGSALHRWERLSEDEPDEAEEEEDEGNDMP